MDEFEQSPTGTYVWVRQSPVLGSIADRTHFLRVTPHWTQVLGWTEEELLAVPFRTLVHPEDLASTDKIAHDGQAFPEDVELEFVNRYRTKPGTRPDAYRWLWWRGVGRTTDAAHGTLWYATVVDVTESRYWKDLLRGIEAERAGV